MSIQAVTTTPRLTRSREHRWLAGVCAGLAHARGSGAGRLRVAFAVTALLGGVGAVFYLACWLIIPAGGRSDGAPSRGVVVLAQACAAAVALALVAALAAVITVFGFGWAVLGVAAAVLVAGLIGSPRFGPAWALLPVAALTLPAIAVATSGLRLSTQTGSSILTPTTSAQASATTYRSGFGTLLVDMRHTSFPMAGTVPLTIDAGVRRTIVALPAGECVHVVVHYDVNPFLVRLGSLFTGHTTPIFSDLVLFGRLYGTQSSGTVSTPPGLDGPTLDVRFTSQGGSLYVRDYPVTVDPSAQPDWPGYPVDPEPRPPSQGVTKKLYASEVRAWKARRATELASARAVDAQLPGPCQ
jgi:phage shock protein PspC (stress-responsive transcriptional regulator)